MTDWTLFLGRFHPLVLHFPIALLSAAPTASRSPSQSFLTERFEPVEARWVRIRLGNLKRLPDWHPGAGEPAWLFVDEVLIGPGTG